jgi:2-C-methyl-D-erythritol 4-phosphate cytidylyltransferase
MNIALITAGGRGERMHQDIPKQFLNVFDKPIIVYTLEAFQSHPDIDSIAVVCLEGWEQILLAYARQFNISKLEIVAKNGVSGQDSIKNGLLAIKKKYSDDDIILVHDGNRPVVSVGVISDCIVQCKAHGSAVCVTPVTEAILEIESGDQVCSDKALSRDRLLKTQTPHAFPLGKLLWAHDEAARRGIKNSVASCTLMIELGEKVYFSSGSEKNFKLTTIDDIEIFKALLKSEKSEWIK